MYTYSQKRIDYILQDLDRLIAKTPNEREVSCWISPKGVWYNIPYMLHEAFAIKMVRERYPRYKYSRKKNRMEILYKMGWISILDGIFTGVLASNLSRMTIEQCAVLQEKFGNRKIDLSKSVKEAWNYYNKDDKV